jgi:UDP-N-acetylmuramoylalanine-D-glutamate ligase
MAAARLARSHGASVTIYDRSPGPEVIAEGFGVASGEWDHLLLRGIDLVIASPGFSERSAPIVETLESGLPLVAEIEYAWSHVKSPVIAITGTNG